MINTNYKLTPVKISFGSKKEPEDAGLPKISPKEKNITSKLADNCHNRLLVQKSPLSDKTQEDLKIKKLLKTISKTANNAGIPQNVVAGIQLITSFISNNVSELDKLIKTNEINYHAFKKQLYKDIESLNNDSNVKEFYAYIGAKENKQKRSDLPEIPANVDILSKRESAYKSKLLLNSIADNLLLMLLKPQLAAIVPDSIEVNNVLKDKILIAGHDSESQNIIKNLKKDTGVSLEVVPNKKLVKVFDDVLRTYSQMGYIMPDHLVLNDDAKFRNKKSLNAQGVYSKLGIKEGSVEQIISPGFNYIRINPSIIENIRDSKDYNHVFDIFRHELEHLQHCEKIGLENFINHPNRNFGFIFNDEEKKIYDDFVEKYCKKSDEQETISINDVLMTYYASFSNNPPEEMKKCCKSSKQLSLQEIKTMSPVIDKIEGFMKFVNKEFKGVKIPENGVAVTMNKDVQIIANYPFTNTVELIAEAARYGQYKQFSPKFIKLLKKLGMPEQKDRCVLPEGYFDSKKD